LRASTHRSYVHKTQRHILPTLGRRRLRRLRPEDLEGLYDSMLHPTDGTRPLAPKTVYEVHLIIRGALDHALRRGLITRNVALTASVSRFRNLAQFRGGESWVGWSGRRLGGSASRGSRGVGGC